MVDINWSVRTKSGNGVYGVAIHGDGYAFHDHKRYLGGMSRRDARTLAWSMVYLTESTVVQSGNDMSFEQITQALSETREKIQHLQHHEQELAKRLLAMMERKKP